MICADCGSRFTFVKGMDEKGKLIAYCRTCAYEIDREICELFELPRPIIVPFVEIRKIDNLAGMQCI